MLSRALDVLRRQGLAALLRRAGRSVWRRRAYSLYSLDCRAADEPVLSPGGPCFAVVRASNLDAMAALVDQAIALDPENEDYFDDVRLGRVVGVLAHDQGRVVHYGFLFKHNRTACLLGLPTTAALIGNAFTVPSARGRGLQGISARLRAAIARQEGFESIVAETAPDNFASQRGMARGGMQALGRLDLVVLLNCAVVRWRRPNGFRPLDLCL